MNTKDLALYAATVAIVNALRLDSPTIDIHEDGTDIDHDTIYLADADDDALAKPVLLVEPLTKGGDRYRVERATAHEAGGWPTHWEFTGTIEEIVPQVIKALDPEEQAKERRRLKRIDNSHIG
jgi:hypothetical protein